MGILTIAFGVLIGLKLAGVTTISWLAILGMFFGIVVFLIIIGMILISLGVEPKSKRYY